MTAKRKTARKHTSKKNAVLPRSKSQKAKPQSLKIVKAALDQHHKRNKAKYDGVMGALPNWMPDPLKFEFNATRNALLENHSHKKILRYMKEEQAASKDTPFWSQCPPLKLKTSLTPYFIFTNYPS